jgi:hypothetical protein
MKCHNCDKESDYLERINPKGVDGVWFCSGCLKEHQEAVDELKSMEREELDLVQFTVVKWICSGKGCRGHTKVRDYGIAPEYWHPRKSIGWFSILRTFWMCSKHYKFYKRLKKRGYSEEHIVRKLFTSKNNITSL